MQRLGAGVLLTGLALTGGPAAAQTGLLVVAHGADEEWNSRVHETVAQVRWTEGPVAVAFLMGPEAVTAGWDSAVARLRREGASAITVVPLMVSSHGAHYRQIEFYVGLRDSWEGLGTMHDHAVSRPPPVPARVTPALDAAPELGAALAAGWSALDSSDRRRPVVLIAHGPTAEAEARDWTDNLSRAAIPALQGAGLRAPVRIGLLRDDAPASERGSAIAAIRDTVQRLASDVGDSVVVLPVLISSGAINRVKIPHDLAGLPVRYTPSPLAPRAELARWIERIAAGTPAVND